MNEVIEFCKLNGLTFKLGPNGYYVKMPDDVILRRGGDLRYDLFLKDIKEYLDGLKQRNA